MERQVYQLDVRRRARSVCSAGDPGSIPGEGNGYPLQYPCLENSTDRGACWATVHGGLLRVGYD